MLIATFNRDQFIERAIESVLSQTHPVSEVIVIDDGSTDDTRTRVESFGGVVKYIYKTNGGKSSALNEGIRQSSSPWLWCFDDDDIAMPDALHRMLAALETCPKAEFAYSGQVVGTYDSGGELRLGNRVDAPTVSADILFNFSLTTFPFRMQGSLIARSAFERVGLLDERYGRGQDYEFLLRLIRHCRGARVAEPTFVWVVHEGPRGPKSARHAGQDRDQVWMHYASMLGRDLRSRLPLGDYLPRPVGDVALNIEDLAVALLKRIAVMGSKGLIAEMAQDLVALGEVKVDSNLGDREREEIWQIPTHLYFQLRVLESPARAIDEIKSTCTTPAARVVVATLVLGLVFAARRSDRSISERCALLKVAMFLSNAAGLAAMRSALSLRTGASRKIFRV